MSNTSKDYGKLKDVSSHFTEETLKNILCMVHNGTEVNVLSWNFGQASAKGDNYLSTVDKIKVNGIVDGKEVQINLVVKSLPQNIGRRNTYRSVDFFYNEIIFYTQVRTTLILFLLQTDLVYDTMYTSFRCSLNWKNLQEIKDKVNYYVYHITLFPLWMVKMIT